MLIVRRCGVGEIVKLFEELADRRRHGLRKGVRADGHLDLLGLGRISVDDKCFLMWLTMGIEMICSQPYTAVSMVSRMECFGHLCKSWS